jgi:hypothetical protein
MMAQFSVGYDTGDPDPNDPIEAVKPRPIGQTVPAPGGEETETSEATETAQPTETSGAATPTDDAIEPPETEAPVTQTDVVAITTARHRLNKDISFAGTSQFTGTSTTASVVLYDVTFGRTATRIGTASITAMGSWSWSTKPGPSRQITMVRVDSSRGGTATAMVRTD